MAEQIKLLAFSGSLRADSLNKKLVKVAAAGAEQAGAEVTVLNLKDSRCPSMTTIGLPKTAFLRAC